MDRTRAEGAGIHDVRGGTGGLQFEIDEGLRADVPDPLQRVVRVHHHQIRQPDDTGGQREAESASDPIAKGVNEDQQHQHAGNGVHQGGQGGRNSGEALGDALIAAVASLLGYVQQPDSNGLFGFVAGRCFNDRIDDLHEQFFRALVSAAVAQGLPLMIEDLPPVRFYCSADVGGIVGI
jgi:hypothetical protein